MCVFVGVWDKVLGSVAERRAETGMLRLFPIYLKGEDLFGLTVSAVTRISESVSNTTDGERMSSTDHVNDSNQRMFYLKYLFTDSVVCFSSRECRLVRGTASVTGATRCWSFLYPSTPPAAPDPSSGATRRVRGQYV